MFSHVKEEHFQETKIILKKNSPIKKFFSCFHTCREIICPKKNQIIDFTNIEKKMFDYMKTNSPGGEKVFLCTVT